MFTLGEIWDAIRLVIAVACDVICRSWSSRRGYFVDPKPDAEISQLVTFHPDRIGVFYWANGWIPLFNFQLLHISWNSDGIFFKQAQWMSRHYNFRTYGIQSGCMDYPPRNIQYCRKSELLRIKPGASPVWNLLTKPLLCGKSYGLDRSHIDTSFPNSSSWMWFSTQSIMQFNTEGCHRNSFQFSIHCTRNTETKFKLTMIFCPS